MVNNYSVDTHQYISEKIHSAEKGKKRAEQQGDLKMQQYYDGQLKELSFFRQYLNKKIDLKTQTYF